MIIASQADASSDEYEKAAVTKVILNESCSSVRNQSQVNFAIFQTAKLIQFKSNFQPVQLSRTRGNEVGNGIAVGWSRLDNATRTTAFTTRVIDCHKADQISQSQDISNKTFCCDIEAQQEHQCLNDLKSIFYFEKLLGWTVRGVILEAACEVALFTSFDEYIDWIDGVMTEA